MATNGHRVKITRRIIINQVEIMQHIEIPSNSDFTKTVLQLRDKFN